MSEVTNLILTFSNNEDEVQRIKEVNFYISDGSSINLVSADYLRKANSFGRDNRKSWYGGTKFLERPLYIGAINHLDLDDFITFLKEIDWEEKEYVQLIVKQEQDEKFKIIELQ
ncbi:hypothetical protein [Fluviicola sp.]|uniref:hypothetical protein n=1 Tax=Fluviicola sp. TaxID=1917219 RepID=UPI003D2CCEB4